MCRIPKCSTFSAGRMPGVLFVLLLAACSSRGSEAGGWVGETVKEEGRTSVRTLRGQVWSARRRLVEQASIGSPLEGPYLLASVTDLTADGTRIYILDGKDLAVKVYSWDGDFLFSFGREGDGPGEFRNPGEMAVDPETGRIFVRDYRRRRINVYTSSGDPLERWPTDSVGSGGGFPMFWSSSGRLYTVGIVRAGMEMRYCTMSVGPQGTAQDTVYIPRAAGEAPYVEVANSFFPLPFGPQWVWAVDRDLRILSGFGDAYRFDMYLPGELPMRVEKLAGLVSVEAEERAWYLARTQALVRSIQPGATYSGPPIPSTKPAYRSLIFDDEARIWVFRDGPGIEREGCAIDAEKVSEFGSSAKSVGHDGLR